MKPPNALVPEIGDMILPHNQFDVEKRLISPLFTTQKTFMSMQILSDSRLCPPCFQKLNSSRVQNKFGNYVPQIKDPVTRPCLFK